MVFTDKLLLLAGPTVQAIELARNTAVQSLGDAQTLAALEQRVFILRIAREGNLRKHRRHIGADQNNEGRVLYAAVRLAPAHELALLRARVLDIRRKLFRFRDLLAACDLLDRSCKNVEGRLRERVFSRRESRTKQGLASALYTRFSNSQPFRDSV